METYNRIHGFDIICLSQTYLNASTVGEDPVLIKPGHDMFCVDHPSNSNRQVCLQRVTTNKNFKISFLQEYIRHEGSIPKNQLVYH